MGAGDGSGASTENSLLDDQMRILRAGREGLLFGIERGWLCDVDVSGPGLLGLEGERADDAGAGDAGDAGRPGGGDLDDARTIVAVDERDGLAILAEQVAGVDVDQREAGWVVLNL